MSTIVLCSASGSPGVTVTALGLTLTWPREVVLVDADRAATQSVLAGYLRGAATQGRGLQSVLQTYRERGDLAEAVLRNRLPLPEPPGVRGVELPQVRRDLVPGFVHLGSVDLFESVWGPLAEAWRAEPYDVVVDAGRITHRGLPPDLVGAADVVALVCRTSLVSLAGVRMYLSALVDAAGPGRVGLVLVGPGRPYGAKEVAEQFGIGVLAEIDWASQAADDLAHGEAQTSAWRRTPLARSCAQASETLAAKVELGRAPGPVAS